MYLGIKEEIRKWKDALNTYQFLDEIENKPAIRDMIPSDYFNKISNLFLNELQRVIKRFN